MFTPRDPKLGWLPGALKSVVLLVGLIALFWMRFGKLIIQRASGIRGRDWPTISALVDIVTVVPRSGALAPQSGQCPDGYLATLTYFYRNPDLQTGDYCRVFNREEEARAWATAFKGQTVLVHVNPRDPSKSVLRVEELQPGT